MRIPNVGIRAFLGILFIVVLSAPTLAQGQGRSGYRMMPLVSDLASEAPKRDGRLVNPWGLAASLSGPWWVANEETHVITAYNRSGVPVRDQDGRFGLDVPNPENQRGAGKPTGVVFNGTTGFVLDSATPAPATFIMVTIDGLITGWNPTSPDGVVQTMLDNSASGAVYTGAAISAARGGPVLAVANFSKGRVDIYNTELTLIASAHDDTVPQDWAPFNVANINGFLYVAYAKRSDEGEEEAGPGLGLIDVFTANGEFMFRFAEGGTLNAPWAIVASPDDFGEFSDSILVGNFGDGRINAFDPETGEFRGQISDRRGHPIELEGLWGLAFGNGGDAGKTNWLYFNAGIEDETHGLFGRIVAKPAHQ